MKPGAPKCVRQSYCILIFPSSIARIVKRHVMLMKCLVGSLCKASGSIVGACWSSGRDLVVDMAARTNIFSEIFTGGSVILIISEGWVLSLSLSY